MTPWLWFAGDPGDHIYDVACDMPTREAALEAALRTLGVGVTVQIIEARSTTAKRKVNEADDDPIMFVRTRNHEIVTLGAPTLHCRRVTTPGAS